MVSGAAAALTKPGFRRDVKLFLGILIGFLVTLTLILMVLLDSTVRQAEELIWENWSETADNVLDQVPTDTITNPDQLRTQLSIIRARANAAGLRIIDSTGKEVSVGYFGTRTTSLERRRNLVRLIVSFDTTDVLSLRRRAMRVGAITLVSAAASILFLLVYLPRIVRPIEELLDHAREVRQPDAHEDETNYLIETFRETVGTLRRQEEQLKRLHEAEKRRADDLERITATLTRSLSAGFIAIDRDGRIVDINAAGREILRLDEAAEFVDQPLEVLGATPFTGLLSEAFRNRASLLRTELDLGDAAGGAIGITTVPLTSESETFLGMLALFSDLTEVRRLEQRLRDAHTLAELGQISAGIAHEFRNSLSTILGYLKLARRGDLDDETDKRVRSAEDEAATLSRAVDGLLAFARPVKIEPVEFDANVLLSELADRYSGQGVDVRIMTDEPLQVHGDPALMRRAFENVVRNAIDAVRDSGRPDGRVSIEASAVSRVISIRDNGVGLADADVSRLFLPFQSDKAEGYGMGLALAKKIVLLHGGSITLTGARGEGATVTIDLATPPGNRPDMA